MDERLDHTLPNLLGGSPAFLELMEQVSRLAPLDRPVLIVGERGTGKELVAARLQGLSARWERPLVKVNCAALSENLLESDLFGHEAGAFTGAARRRQGRFERADGGTLFLDEIASASPAVQEKVLRVIEYGEFERLGGSATVRCDVRVLAAANVDLPAAADAGRFRHDLLDRLAFDVVTVPPLRARRGDIALLAETFGHAMAVEMGWDGFPGFTAAAMAALETHPWPGNVRELRNAVERAVVRWPEPESPVGAVPLDPFASPWRPVAEPARMAVAEPARTTVAPGAAVPAPQRVEHDEALSWPLDLDARLAGVERDLLQRTLAAHHYNQRAAAGALSLSYAQLRGRLKKHGLG